jgi:hypothetical protein
MEIAQKLEFFKKNLIFLVKKQNQTLPLAIFNNKEDIMACSKSGCGGKKKK